MKADRCAPDSFSPPEGDAPSPGGRERDDEWRDELDSLYRERADHLVRRVMRAATDRETARDVVHEAFARLAALGGQRRLAVARPDAYLYRICINLVRDLGRAGQPQRRPAQSAETDVDPYNPIIHLEQRDDLRRLEAAVLRLKPKTREIFLAKRLDGMTYAEIAERTGLSVKGVEKHMTKAIATIDRIMGRNRP